MRVLRINRIFLILLSICGSVAARAQEGIAIKAGRLIDGTGTPAIENAVILVRGDRIEAAGPASTASIPKAFQVIDLSSDTVMPGMINGHDHPTVRAYTGDRFKRPGANSLVEQLNEMEEPPVVQAGRGVRDLRVDLVSGVTSEYVVGEVGHNDIYLKQLADAGIIPAPRMFLSGPWIMPTGGYDPIPETNGPWAMRNMVRKNFEAGAQHIKIVISSVMPTGPNAGQPYGPGAANFTKEEIEAVADEAHRLGLKVTAHAIDAASIRFALDAGIDSIQHADELTPDIIDLFLKHHAGIINTYVAMVQTAFTAQDFHKLDAEFNSPKEWIDHSRVIIEGVVAKNQSGGSLGGPLQDYLKRRYAELKQAKDRGVPIAVGTDNMQGLLDLDLEHLVNAGFTPLEALDAATGTAAKVLGISKDVGTIEKGKYADIISIRGKPDENIRDLGKVNFVMVGGKIYGGLSFR